MSWDMIVAGCGGVGAAALMHLAESGAKVLGLDRFTPPHDRGSSHGRTRVIRQAYFEHPDYVPLLISSYQLWSELEARVGRRLYVERGLLQIGQPDGVVVPGILESARRHGLVVEVLDRPEVEARFPRFAIPEGMRAVLETRAGYLLVEACVAAHLDEAARFGAQTAFGEALVSWRRDGAGIEVTTTQRTLHTARLVIAPGAWAPSLLAELGVPFKIVRKSLFWYEAPPDPTMPVWLYETPAGVYYGFPPLEGQGLKAAEHTGGESITDPEALDQSLDEREAARVERFLAEHLPAVGGARRAHSVCMYTMTPDEHFIVDRHPREPQVLICCGLSGHGFKMVPALGQALAQIALEDRMPEETRFLGLARFVQSGMLLP